MVVLDIGGPSYHHIFSPTYWISGYFALSCQLRRYGSLTCSFLWVARTVKGDFLGLLQVASLENFSPRSSRIPRREFSSAGRVDFHDVVLS